MKIDILAVGKIKEKYYRDAADEYLKRLSRYAKVTVTEVKEKVSYTTPLSGAKKGMGVHPAK